MTADLYEDNAGTLYLAIGDKLHDVTGAQFDSTLIADAESYADEIWGDGEPGPVYDRVDDTIFQQRDDERVHIDLSKLTHIATYEDGDIIRHNEGGMAANIYLDTSNLAEGASDYL